MKNKVENPWESMGILMKRRIDSQLEYDFFWITESNGRYGLYFKLSSPFASTQSKFDLKKITHIKQNAKEGFGEFILLLNNNEDWEIFYDLCLNLILTAREYSDESKMIIAVENRLLQWQHLLKNNSTNVLSKERQMGLFSELLCLRDVVATSIGLESAINCWCGADYDKQDFSLEEAAIEVKSYTTSKGKSITISSIEQLFSEKKSFFLLAYGLSEVDTGCTILDLSKEISADIESLQVRIAFENKLLSYGFAPELSNQKLCKFVVDGSNQYLVNSGFPKLTRDIIPTQIRSLSYQIDLSLCESFETAIVQGEIK